MAGFEDPWRFIVEFCKSRGYDDFLGFKKPLTKKTELVGDLRITGDDAVEFLSDFMEVFSIDMGNLNFHEYFDEEGFWPLPRFRKWEKKRKLTLGMLEQAVKNGCWNSPDVEHDLEQSGLR